MKAHFEVGTPLRGVCPSDYDYQRSLTFSKKGVES